MPNFEAVVRQAWESPSYAYIGDAMTPGSESSSVKVLEGWAGGKIVTLAPLVSERNSTSPVKYRAPNFERGVPNFEQTCSYFRDSSLVPDACRVKN